jgi:hypothetical protein
MNDFYEDNTVINLYWGFNRNKPNVSVYSENVMLQKKWTDLEFGVSTE